MQGDYKYAAQVKAEELAEERYGKDYYDLPEDVQCKLYEEGMQAYIDSQVSAADALNDREEP